MDPDFCKGGQKLVETFSEQQYLYNYSTSCNEKHVHSKIQNMLRESLACSATENF